MTREISSNALNIKGQPMFKLIDEAKVLESSGSSIVHLEIGDPDFDTPKNIVDAAVESLRNSETHYVSSWGLGEFRTAIQDATEMSRGFKPDLGQVLVTPGANIAIFYAIFTLVNKGQEVLVPDPGFPTYLSTIEMCGAIPVAYPLRPDNHFEIRAEDIEPLITRDTRLLVINNPGNPTGAITNEAELRKIYELAEKYDLYIYADEIYARMTFGEVPYFSIASLDQCMNRVILSNGFSKAFAMTGWRLGTIVAPLKVAERMMMLLQTTASCVSPFIQRAGIEAIRGEQSDVEAMMAEYKSRRDLVVSRLNEIPGVRCEQPKGAFYALVDVSSFGKSSEEIAHHLLYEGHVAVVPGSNFGRQSEGFIRISFAKDKLVLSEGIDRIANSLAKLRDIDD